jgi:hypothetical protein
MKGRFETWPLFLTLNCDEVQQVHWQQTFYTEDLCTTGKVGQVH